MGDARCRGGDADPTPLQGARDGGEPQPIGALQEVWAAARGGLADVPPGRRPAARHGERLAVLSVVRQAPGQPGPPNDEGSLTPSGSDCPQRVAAPDCAMEREAERESRRYRGTHRGASTRDRAARAVCRTALV